MKSKERVLRSIHREKVDRVPFFYRDVPEVDARLRRDWNLSSREDLLRYLNIDFRWVSPRYCGPDLGDPSTGRIRNIYGIEFVCRNAGHGAYWEPEKYPLATVEDPAALDDYPWPKVEWYDFSVMEDQLKQYSDYAVMTAPGVATSPGVLTVIQDLFGMEKTLMDMYLNPALWKKTAAQILEFNLAFQEKMYEICGNRIDFYRIGEDYGSQQGLLFSPELWKEFIRPNIEALMEIPKNHGSCYYQHSCGGIRELIPLLIEAGVDVIDPLQTLAAGMDPENLKKDYGSKVCFSGGIDEQQLLPHGTPEEVKREVWRMLDIMGTEGGYFLGPTHNFQEDIPTENIKAMYEAALEWSD